jgi:predicted nucleic acid-binding protein
VTFLLDTNVVSELRKPPDRVDPGVRGWADAIGPHLMYVSVISVMEIEIGVARAERRDPEQGRALRDWLSNKVLPAFEGRILPVDLAVARSAAVRHVPDPRPERDCLIAATADVHGLTVITRNVNDFEPLGAAVTNPWS